MDEIAHKPQTLRECLGSPPGGEMFLGSSPENRKIEIISPAELEDFFDDSGYNIPLLT